MKRLWLIFALISVFGTIYGQQLPISNQYLINRYVLSPSYAGLSDGASIYAGYRDQWVDFVGAPVTKFMNIYGPVGKSVGVGGTIISDQEGIFNRTFGELSYAYHTFVASEHEISFSLSGKFFQSSINLDQATILDLANDNVLQLKQTQNETRFNAGASILYRFNGLNVSFGAPLLLENKSQYYNSNTANNKDSYILRRHIMGHVSYDLDIMDGDLQVTPYAIFRKANAAPFNYEFAVRAMYKKMAWLGLAYRSEGIMGASVGFQINEQVMFNYTYEFLGNGITGNSSGTHEIGLGLIVGKGMKDMKAKQNQLLETADSLATETKGVKDEFEEEKEKNEKNRKKTENQIDILQQRLNDVELEMGKIKNVTENITETGIIGGTNLTDAEAIRKQKELDAEIMDIERQLRDVGGEFFVVVEAFKVPENAKTAITLWADRGLKVNMIYNEMRDFYYIYAGKYATYNEALALKNSLKDEGIFGWIYLWAK